MKKSVAITISDERLAALEVGKEACQKVEKLFACRNGKAVRAVTSHSSHRVAPCGEFWRSVG